MTTHSNSNDTIPLGQSTTNTDIDIETSVSQGQYAWCGNKSFGSSTGHFLSLTTSHLDKTQEPCMLLTVSLTMNDDLARMIRNRTMVVHIMNHQNHLVCDTGQWCPISITQITDNTMTWMARIWLLKECEGKEFKVVLRTRTNAHRVHPSTCMFEKTFYIPTLLSPPINDYCPICGLSFTTTTTTTTTTHSSSDSGERTKEYIGPCGHSFHMECLYNTLSNENMLKQYDGCECCKHSAGKIETFPCLVCNTPCH